MYHARRISYLSDVQPKQMKKQTFRSQETIYSDTLEWNDFLSRQQLLAQIDSNTHTERHETRQCRFQRSLF